MDFIHFRVVDLVDIILVAFLLYQVYALIRGTAALNIFIGVAAVYLFWKLVEFLQMELLSEILGQFLGVGFIALIVVFQQEIRKFLLLIGSANFRRRRRFLAQLKWLRASEKVIDSDVIVAACKRFVDSKTGVLIVFSQDMPLSMYTQSGDLINANISVRLLESIFHFSSPLHDGAVVIADDKIVAAGVILPLTERDDLPSRLGLRHRAAVGITEKTDAVALVVSEETGTISIAKGGELQFVTANNLKKELDEILKS
ncbi:MAG: diadenylate cyclase CdaA [Schleiferiaceae bacterium]|nr:diadenylate cyclase CdaA [Schleiferiaceae bacterium]